MEGGGVRERAYPEAAPAGDEAETVGATTPERVLGSREPPVMATMLDGDADALPAGADTETAAGALLALMVTVERIVVGTQVLMVITETEGAAELAGADAIGADEAGTEATGADEAGAETTGADEAGAEATGADDAGADDAGADDAGADGAGADEADETATVDPGALEAGAEGAGAEYAGADEAGTTDALDTATVVADDLTTGAELARDAG